MTSRVNVAVKMIPKIKPVKVIHADCVKRYSTSTITGNPFVLITAISLRRSHARRSRMLLKASALAAPKMRLQVVTGQKWVCIGQG